MNPNVFAVPPGTQAPAAQPPAAQPPQDQTAVTLQALLQKSLQEANQPFDYGTEAAKARSAYQSVFGTPESRVAPQSAETTKLYEKARDKALEEVRGNLGVRGLLGGGVGDKEIAETGNVFAGGLSSALNKLKGDASEDELKGVFDFVTKAAESRGAEKKTLLSLLPSLLKPDYGAGVVGEYNFYATQERAAGREPVSFNEYQNLDANRKAKIQAAGLNQNQLQSALDRVSDDYRQDPIVKQYTTALPGWQFMASIKPETTNPADDIGMIYAFAKIMDPESVVREGEYATVQKYAQSWAETFGFNAARIFSNTKFLTSQALKNMQATAGAKMNALTIAHDSARGTYEQRIDDLKSGKTAGGLPVYSPSSGSDPNADLEDDITQLATSMTREQIIDELSKDYQEFTRDQIAAKVYTLIPDKKSGPMVESL